MKRVSIHHRGFTLVELIAVLVIGTILLLIGLAGMREFSARSSGIRCLANLRNLHTAALAYAADHQGEIPIDHDNQSTGYTWYMALVKYLPHPGYGVFKAPYFCLANRNQAALVGNGGWTNYAANSRLFGDGSNMLSVGSRTGEEATAYLAGRRGPRFSTLAMDKAFLMDARGKTGGFWYLVNGAKEWTDSYPVHGDRINVIFIGGHARTVAVYPRNVLQNGDLNELRAEWFWPVR